MKEESDLSWAKELRFRYLNSPHFNKEKYDTTKEFIETNSKGRLTAEFNQYLNNHSHIKQIKEIEWEELYDIIKLSGKRFEINCPEAKEYHDKIKEPPQSGEIYRLFAVFSQDKCGIEVFGDTGIWKEDRTGYDGYGCTTESLLIYGVKDREGNWITPIGEVWK